jgi:hypothetical protein
LKKHYLGENRDECFSCSSDDGSDGFDDDELACTVSCCKFDSSFCKRGAEFKDSIRSNEFPRIVIGLESVGIPSIRKLSGKASAHA